MKLRTLGRAILRRWYAFVAGLLAVGALSYFVYGQAPVDYKSSGSVVLLPSTKSVGTEGNPYLFLNGLGQAMDVLTRRLSAPDTVARLTKGYSGVTYTALPDVTSGSSILVVTVKSGTAETASSALKAVLTAVPSELSGMQDELSVPNASRIASMQVAAPTTPVADVKPRLQLTAVSTAGGVLLILLLTALLDGMILRLNGQRRARLYASPEAPVHPAAPTYGADPAGSPLTPADEGVQPEEVAETAGPSDGSRGQNAPGPDQIGALEDGPASDIGGQGELAAAAVSSVPARPRGRRTSNGRP